MASEPRDQSELILTMSGGIREETVGPKHNKSGTRSFSYLNYHEYIPTDLSKKPGEKNWGYITCNTRSIAFSHMILSEKGDNRGKLVFELIYRTYPDGKNVRLIRLDHDSRREVYYGEDGFLYVREVTVGETAHQPRKPTVEDLNQFNLLKDGQPIYPLKINFGKTVARFLQQEKNNDFSEPELI